MEETVTYDDSEQTSWCQRDNVTKLCKKGSENFQNQKVDGEAKNGNYITFDITKDMKAPVHLYYHLDNFYHCINKFFLASITVKVAYSRYWTKSFFSLIVYIKVS